ncbi:DNA-3-methyladenine glycosylase I [Paracoccus sp. NSM]|uniref:DNA-3-methyladenine glycosylase I n=1 Tax=Paracoccus sp. NSM TaxID=3457784 RepID=UPI004035F35F
MIRCNWCGSDPLYVAYHDTEWGVPQRDGRALWESLILEGFQAGLSWITVLRKRPAFRAEFEGFDPARIAHWDEARIAQALRNPGIIRHRGKIEAAIRGARAWARIEAQEPGGFSGWIWSFTGGAPIQNSHAEHAAIPVTTPESTALSKALKARGFGFCGPVTVLAFMQANGLVNDHVTGCFRHAQIRALSQPSG